MFICLARATPAAVFNFVIIAASQIRIECYECGRPPLVAQA